MAVRHTSCIHCGQDIEGFSPYRKHEWRDRGNNRTCPSGPRKGGFHAPYREPVIAARPYQPKTGARCSCKPGIARDNCPACEGTGWRIDFAAIRAR
jgi:hypothetical protein